MSAKESKLDVYVIGGGLCFYILAIIAMIMMFHFGNPSAWVIFAVLHIIGLLLGYGLINSIGEGRISILVTLEVLFTTFWGLIAIVVYVGLIVASILSFSSGHIGTGISLTILSHGFFCVMLLGLAWALAIASVLAPFFALFLRALLGGFF
ncbi:hypothetical protein ACFL0C_02425 [Patescibacteria group bacterium]